MRPTTLDIELAAARLAAGYHDANDTPDDLRNPLCLAAIDFMLNCDRTFVEGELVIAIPDSGWLGELVRLYLEIVDGETAVLRDPGA